MIHSLLPELLQICVANRLLEMLNLEIIILFLYRTGTGTMDHPDLGAGAMTAEEVQKAILTSLSLCVAEVASTAEVIGKLEKSVVVS